MDLCEDKSISGYSPLDRSPKCQEIKSIESANIYGIENPPDGFIEWATEHGVVSTKDIVEWINLKIKQEQPKGKQ